MIVSLQCEMYLMNEILHKFGILLWLNMPNLTNFNFSYLLNLEIIIKKKQIVRVIMLYQICVWWKCSYKVDNDSSIKVCMHFKRALSKSWMATVSIQINMIVLPLKCDFSVHSGKCFVLHWSWWLWKREGCVRLWFNFDLLLFTRTMLSEVSSIYFI